MRIEIAPPTDPWVFFAEWFEIAKQHETIYPDAMVIATVGEGMCLSTRTVLMKSFDERGIVFHTNRLSRKGEHLSIVGSGACTFLWKSLMRQVHMEGKIEKITDEESDSYFATRLRGSQIGAWASLQSKPLESRAELEGRVRLYEEQFAGGDVPRPEHWGGYRLIPSRIEFWSEQPYRLHDRILYVRIEDDWTMERLYP